MSYVAGNKEDKEGVEAGFAAKSHRIRITLTAQGPKLKALEKGERYSIAMLLMAWHFMLYAVMLAVLLLTCSLLPVYAVSQDLINRAKDKDLKVKGPIRMPTKTLIHTTRQLPSPRP
jgi:small subunit ribosomal protein S20e